MEEAVERIVRAVDVETELDQVRVPEQRRGIRDLDPAFVWVRAAIEKIRLSELERRGSPDGRRLATGSCRARPARRQRIAGWSGIRNPGPTGNRISLVSRGSENRREPPNHPVRADAVVTPVVDAVGDVSPGHDASGRIPAEVVVADGQRVIVGDLPVDFREQKGLVAGAGDDTGQALDEREAIVSGRRADTSRRQRGQLGGAERRKKVVRAVRHCRTREVTPLLVEAEKVEQLVLLDRAADARAVLVPLVIWLDRDDGEDAVDQLRCVS